MLNGVPYLKLYGREPSAIEGTFAVFMNVLEVDEKGKVTNRKHAEKRATDYLRSYCDATFKVDPPFEDWEIELH